MSTSSPTRTASRLLLAGLAIVVLAIAASIAGALVPAPTIDPLATRVEAAGTDGIDPFTPDLRLVDEVARPSARSDYVGEVGGLRSGVLETAEQACDKQGLLGALVDDQARLTAWTSVLGVSIGDLDAYVARLQPVALTHDTVVLNHAYVDEQAQPNRTILQAGTLVLVDSDGVPRVLCKCGNPLLTTPPVAMETPIGELWPTFDSKAIISLIPVQPPTLTPTPVPTSAAVPEPVATVVPTALPLPTATSAPPATATPLPIATPTATPIPVAPPSTATPNPTPTPAPTTTATPETPPLQISCAVDPSRISRETVFTVTVQWTPADTLLNVVIDVGASSYQIGASASPVTPPTALRFQDSLNFGAPITFVASGANDTTSTNGSCDYTPIIEEEQPCERGLAPIDGTAPVTTDCP